MRYAIKVVDDEGNTMFLRHGRVAGQGPIVQFPNRKKAQDMLENMRPGLDDCHAFVVLFGGPTEDTVLA